MNNFTLIAEFKKGQRRLGLFRMHKSYMRGGKRYYTSLEVSTYAHEHFHDLDVQEIDENITFIIHSYPHLHEIVLINANLYNGPGRDMVGDIARMQQLIQRIQNDPDI